MSAIPHFSDQENAARLAAAKEEIRFLREANDVLRYANEATAEKLGELVSQRDTARDKLAKTTAHLDRVLAAQRPWQEENEFLFQEILRLNRDVLNLRKDNLDLRRELTALKAAKGDVEAAAQEFEQRDGQNLDDVHGPR